MTTRSITQAPIWVGKLPAWTNGMAMFITLSVMPVLMWISTAAFLIYVPVLPLAAVVLILIALAAVFAFGIHLGIEYARRNESQSASLDTSPSEALDIVSGPDAASVPDAQKDDDRARTFTSAATS